MTDNLKYLTTPVSQLTADEKEKLWALYQEFVMEKGLYEMPLLHPDSNPMSPLPENNISTVRLPLINQSIFFDWFSEYRTHIPIDTLLPYFPDTPDTGALFFRYIKPISLEDIFYCFVCIEWRRQKMLDFKHCYPPFHDFTFTAPELHDIFNINIKNEEIIWILITHAYGENFSLPKVAYYIHTQIELKEKPHKLSLWQKLKNLFN